MLGRWTLGGTRGLALLALGSFLLVVAACQLVAGVQDRTADPIASGCALPSGKGPQVRLADFATTTDVVDICIRATGTAWGEPLLLNGGSGCGSAQNFATTDASKLGFMYRDVTIPFTAPASTVDVKLVAAGQTCAAAALTEGDGLSLSSSSVTTLLRVGGNGVAQKLVALPESNSDTDATQMRFVHAMPGVGPLDLGNPPGGVTQLPTVVNSVLLSQPTSFGGAPAPGTSALNSTVDSHGYFTFPEGNYSFVAGVHGTSPESAVFLTPLANSQEATFSLYAIGEPHSDAAYQQALLCQENLLTTGRNPFVISCASSTLPTITFDVFNTALYGPNSPDFTQRETYLASPQTSPLPARDTDLMCLVELDFYNDIQAIAAMAGPSPGTNTFPYSYYIQTDESTPFTVSAEQDGAAPPPITQAPCASTNPTEVQSALNCMQEYCDTVPDSSAGTLPLTTDCLTTNCTGPLGALLLAPDPTCYDCIIDHVASDQTYATTQKECTTQVSQAWGFAGQVSQMILSRYPIIASDKFILPSTSFRQAVLYVRVQLPLQQVDFYCSFLSSSLVAGSVPYNGNYGAGGNPTYAYAGGAYANEQLYQATLLADWVKTKSGDPTKGTPTTPAIVTGDWRSGRGLGMDAGVPPPMQGLFQTPTTLDEPTVDYLFNTMGFVPATSAAWAAQPQCNFCPQSENSTNAGQSQGYFVLQPFLYNWGAGAAGATTSEQLLYTQPMVPIGNSTVPVSQYFGLNVSVLRPQTSQ